MRRGPFRVRRFLRGLPHHTDALRDCPTPTYRGLRRGGATPRKSYGVPCPRLAGGGVRRGVGHRRAVPECYPWTRWSSGCAMRPRKGQGPACGAGVPADWLCGSALQAAEDHPHLATSRSAGPTRVSSGGRGVAAGRGTTDSGPASAVAGVNPRRHGEPGGRDRRTSGARGR